MYLYDELFLGLWVLHGAPRACGLLVSALPWVARVCAFLWVPLGTPGSSGLLVFALSWDARVCVSQYVPVLGCGFPVRNVFVAYLFRGMYLYDELFLGLWVLHGAPRSSGLLVSALSWVARVCVFLWVLLGTPGSSGLLVFALSWDARVCVS